MDLITISFSKWAKWNPRKDIKNPTWFAMSNRITEDDQIQTLTDKEFRAFIHLFCLASQQQGKHTASVNLAKAERITGMAKQVFLKTIERLSSLGICAIVDEPGGHATDGSRTDDGQIVSATEQNNTIQDRTEQPGPSAPEAAAPILTLDNRTADFVASVKPDVQAHWLTLYEDKAWVEREVGSAYAWCLANPQRAPKSNISAFLTNWLKRGWERHRKTMPAKPVPKPIPASGIRLDASCEPAAAEAAPVNREASLTKIRDLMNKAGNLGKQGAS